MALPTPGATKPCLIYIVSKKIPSGQLAHLKGIARKKNFHLSATLNDNITHIVSALPSHERTQAVLEEKIPPTAEVVTLQWLTTSFSEGKPTQVTDRYRLLKTLPISAKLQEVKSSPKPAPFHLSEYECQRPTLLSHHNHVFTDALELLERYYQHVDHKLKDTRALAFRQASCVLKALPRKVAHINEVAHLHRIGRHSAQVIEDILRNGFSLEVEDCKKNEWFQCIELFTTIYGCGTATADKWYKLGLRTIADVQRQSREISLTDTQRLGLQYYDHLSVPVSREEAEVVRDYVFSQAAVCSPGTTVEVVGGYRRGKPFGHDIDLLLSHSEREVTDSLLDTLVDHLKRQNVVIDVQKFTSKGQEERHRSGVFDSLDKAFCILKLDGATVDYKTEVAEESCPRAELIRRVDLIIAHHDQYPFALVSWTGSKQFNRSLRRYSDKELNMSVTAHGIYDRSKLSYVPATSEEEVFSILKLDYLQPWQRNC